MRVIMAAEDVDVDIEGEETEISKGEQEDAATGFLQDHHLNSAWRLSDKAVPWNLDSTISEENRTVIEKMLLEEQYYLTRKRLPEKLWTGIKDSEKPVIKKPANKSSLFPMKWTKEEKDLFEQGLTKFGRRWTKIAKLIGSRTVLQVKSYARQYFKNKMKQDIAYIEEKNLCNSQILSVSSEVDQKLKPICPSSFQLRGRADPNLNAVKIEKLSDDEDVNITDETDDPLDSTDQEEMEQKDLLDACSRSCEAAVHSICASNFDAQACNTLNTAEQFYPVTGTSKEQATGFSKSAADCPEYENNGNKGPTVISFSHKENLVPWNRHHGKRSEDLVKEMLDGSEEAKDQTDISVSNGINEEHQDEEEELKPPEQEIDMDRNIISEEEKQAIPEFFEGRPSKTPERYLKIRNFILDQWEKCKPKYLNKTSVRPGLKNCGDVNCIGRIHTYLELIGAINFNCEQAVYNRPRPADKTRTKEGNDSMEAYQLAHRLQSMRTRRRRVRDPLGKWCDSKDLEGQTFEHLSAEELARRRVEEEQYRPAKSSRAPRQIKSTFDPFQLIPCLPFTDEKQEPFTVKVSSEALLILEMHSHVSLAEVIGLLGGRYIETEKILEVGISFTDFKTVHCTNSCASTCKKKKKAISLTNSLKSKSTSGNFALCAGANE
ncbi:histone H2A deubiquitinase MYSM1-like [Protopterus annectens]|uniref:histone H2A deubiquitinase MYSM1-like n=1 Tax=Protopterus annectens TaxID=7888 RepID=UPI001CFA5A13|nr:histone H2A deubiquitinase MYSM1-like [Protopterus annectens]